MTLRARLLYGTIGALCAAIAVFDGFEFLELKLLDLRYRWLDRAPSGDVVIVAIDPDSLAQRGVWPWPREDHAALLERLATAGARQVAFDIDFSSRSTPAGDAALATALAAHGANVVLPVFRQRAGLGVDGARLVETAPRPEFARHAQVASINVRPDADGIVRRVAYAEAWPSGTIPSLAAWLARVPAPAPSEYYVDFGIRAEAFARLSYADVLAGAFDAVAVRGKTVLVGATAVELGDHITVPRLATLPGVYVEALAYETLIQGRAIARVSPFVSAVIALLLALVLGPKFATWRWPNGLAGVGVVTVGSVGGAVAVQAIAPVALDVVPWIAAAAASYGVGLVRAIDRQANRLVADAVEAGYRRATTRAIVEQSFDAIVALSDVGKVEAFNPAAERIFGYAAADTIGWDATILFPDAIDGSVGGGAVRFLQSLGATTGKRRVEARAQRADGEVFAVELAIGRAQVSTTGLPVRSARLQKDVYICTLRDITDQKAAAAKIQRLNQRLSNRVVKSRRELRSAHAELLRNERLATLGRFVATVSHELRNPLGTIQSSVQTIARSLAGDALRAPLERIRRNIARCDRIIAELLDFTRDPNLEIEPTTVDAWVTDVLGELATPETVAIDWLPGAGDCVLKFDRERMRRALVNVIENAVQAVQARVEGGTAPDRPFLRIATTVAANRLEIAIGDSGAGIDAARLPHLFEPLYSTKEFGVGLGLTIARQALRLHRGDVVIHSVSGAGTEVTLWLPLVDVQEASAA